MIGLQNDVAKYFAFILILLVQSHTANALGIAIGSFVPSARVGQIIAPLIVVVFLIFGGQFVNLDNAPESLKWIQYISFISYSNKALAQNEFEGLTFTISCPNNSTTCITTTGSAVLSQFALDKPWLWYCILINVALSIAYMIIGAIGFAKTTAPLLRLSSESPSKKVDGESKTVNGF